MHRDGYILYINRVNTQPTIQRNATMSVITAYFNSMRMEIPSAL